MNELMMIQRMKLDLVPMRNMRRLSQQRPTCRYSICFSNPQGQKKPQRQLRLFMLDK